MASGSKGLGHALIRTSKNIAAGAHSPTNQHRLSSQLGMHTQLKINIGEGRGCGEGGTGMKTLAPENEFEVYIL